MGLAGIASNDSPRAPPRCGGAPAAVRTHPEHAPDGPDTGGHRPGPPGRVPGVNGHGAPTATSAKITLEVVKNASRFLKPRHP